MICRVLSNDGNQLDRFGQYIDTLTESGINWNDLAVMTKIGINWNDLAVLSKTGINWNDFGVMTQDRNQLE